MESMEHIFFYHQLLEKELRVVCSSEQNTELLLVYGALYLPCTE